LATAIRPVLTNWRANGCWRARPSAASRNTLSTGVGRPQEARRAVGHQHVLQRRLVALLVVAVQQLRRRAALQHGGQLPGQVVGVGDAGVAAARAEGADHLGRIAHQEHAAVPHASTHSLR
jgi:hypothetical protein